MRMQQTFFRVSLTLSVLFIASLRVQADEGQVWVVSTRGMPRCNPSENAIDKLDVRLRDEHGCWVSADADSLLDASNPAIPTSLYIHGNRTSHSLAVANGMRMFRVLEDQSDQRPFRLVIWSWPSERIPGLARHDIRAKAAGSDVQSSYVAQLLHRLKPDQPVCLIGYSFGARVVTGALELTGGGRIAGRELPTVTPPEEKRPLRAVLIAAAVDSDWFLPGRRNGLALDQTERILVTRNSSDRILRWYPLMYRKHGPKAMGAVGPSQRTGLLAGAKKLNLLNVGGVVGRRHDLASYLRSGSLRKQLGEYAYLEDSHDTELLASVEEAE